MRKFYARLLVILFVFVSSLHVQAQITDYTFSAASGTFTPLVGGTPVATSTSVNDFLDDTRTSIVLPIGFTFKYNGIDYTQVVAMSDGFLSFNTAATSAFSNNLATSTTARRPLVAPLWDDLSGEVGTSSASYSTTGTAGSRVFTMEWLNWLWNYNATGATISFQVKLYEGTNVIEFIYRPEAGSINSGSASIGITAAGTGSGNYLSLNNATASPTVSSTSETTSINAKPASGQIYRFTPPATPPLDLSLESISGLPTSPCPVSGQAISATIENTGTNTIDFAANNATITVNVTGASTQTLTVTLNNGTLAPGATMTVPLFPNADLTAGGVHTFNGEVDLAGDGLASNNTAPAVTANIIFETTIPFNNDFTGFTGANLNTVFPLWVEARGTTPTGTASDWTEQTGLGGGSNVTAVVNLYTNDNVEWIIGPRFQATANSVLSFDVAVTNWLSTTEADVMGADDKVAVMVSTDCGLTWTEIHANTAADNLPPSLTPQSVSLAAYAGQDIMIAFRATDGPADNTQDYDFHLDNIMISESCTGATVGGTTMASTTSLCFGEAVELTLNGATTGAGITFQWQSSTDGSTWTDITGATSSSYSAAPLENTQYRAVVTCTNGGATSNSVPAIITITSMPTYAALPYTQDFENWVDGCATTDRPDAHWALSPIMGNNAWRRNDQGASASWSSNNGDYSPAFSTGAHSARFHTWNAPDGAVGTMDLYINLSTDASSKLLRFDYRNNGGSDVLKVFLSEDGGQTFTQVGTDLGVEDPWGTYQLILNSNSATAVIRLEATSDFGASDIGVDNLQVLVGCTGAPTAGTVTTSGIMPLCNGASIEMQISGYTAAAGITLQWQSSPDGTTWTDITGETGTTLIASPTSSTYYRVVVTCTNTSDVVETPALQVTVNNPQVISTTPATRCGIGTVNLQATTDPGNTIRWYTSATGGVAIGTGNSFTTPSISATTTYYAAAETGISPLGNGAQNSTSYESPYYHFYGGKRSQYLVLASELTALGITAGNINSIGFNVVTPGTSYSNFSISMKHTTASAMTTTMETGLTTVYTAASVTPVAGVNMYSFLAPFAWDGTSNVILEVCWNNNNTGGTSTVVRMDPTPFVAHAYYRADNASDAVICGTTSATSTTSLRPQIIFDPAYCSGTRTAVEATVNVAPDITILPASVSVCAGQSALLAVNSANTGYTYSWMPGGLTGASVNVSPAATTTYVVTATDNSGGASNGCVMQDSIVVTVNPVPVAPVITPSAPSVCLGEAIQLSTNVGVASGNFTVTGATLSTSSGSNSPFYRLYEGSRRQYLVRASELTALGLSPGGALNSLSINVSTLNGSPNNLVNFSIKIGSTTATTLTSFQNTGAATVYHNASLSPVSGANLLTFSNSFIWDGTSNIYIEMCFDNDPDNSCDDGSPICWGNTPTVSMASAGFTSTVYLFNDNFDGPRSICSDNTVDGTSNLRPVMIFGFTNPTITWSPVTGLFTDAAGTTPYVAGTHASSVYSVPTAATTYTVTSTTSQGCSSASPVTVNIKPAPAIVTQPLAAVTSCVGGSVTFTVTASGDGLTYQWRKDGTDITGATSSTFTINNLAYTDAGSYSVVVAGTCSPSVTSDNAVLTVSDNNWVGTSNSDWNNPLNWCGGVPTATTSVLIPAGTPFSPIIQGNAPVNNITINAGATLEVTSSGRLIVGGNMVNDGTLNTTSGAFEFVGAANQSVPAISAANIIMNGAGGITLTGNMNIGTALTLTNGNITLGNNNLVMTGGSVGSAASHIVTNGTGTVTNNGVGAVSVVFPVGPTATTYNPVTIANGQGRNYTVGVVTGLPTTPALANASRAVNRTWTISANTAPTSAINISLQYADADVNASATATANMQAGVSNGTNWLIATPAAGHAPTGTATGRIIHFQTATLGQTILANVGGINFPTAVPNVDADITSVVLMPNVVDNMTLLRVKTLRTTKVNWSVIDANGRTVMTFSKQVFAGQNDIQLALGSLASGSYQLVGTTEKGRIESVRFVRQ